MNIRFFLVAALVIGLAACKPTTLVSTATTIENEAELTISLSVPTSGWDVQKDDKSLLVCELKNLSSTERSFLTEPKHANFQLKALGADQRQPMDLELLDPYFATGSTGATVKPGEEKIIFSVPLQAVLLAQEEKDNRFAWYLNGREDRESPLLDQDGKPQSVTFWFLAQYGPNQLRSERIQLTLSR